MQIVSLLELINRSTYQSLTMKQKIKFSWQMIVRKISNSNFSSIFG